MLCHVLVMLRIIMSSLLPCNFGLFSMVRGFVFMVIFWLSGLGCMMLCHVLVMLCIIMSSLLPCKFGLFSMVRGFVFMVVVRFGLFSMVLGLVFMLVFRMVLGIIFMLGFVFMLVFMLLMKLFNRPIGPLCMMCCHVLMMLGIFMSAFFPGNSRLLSMVISFIFMMYFMIVMHFNSSLSRMVFNHLFMMLCIIMPALLPGDFRRDRMMFSFVCMVFAMLIGLLLDHARRV